ncbi:MAG: class I SAM-dependent methyltransferase [Candidatus Omnitrophica bacterium]|nr:class I SAM-dependent methyltransferase [Candidatus Omnitrophota bacterium]
MMNCMICNSGNITPAAWGGYFHEGVKYNIVSCVSCGFTFVDPMPADEVITNMYSNGYFNKFYSMNSGSYIKDILANDRKKIQMLKRLKNKGTILDVGCGRGRFIELALKQGYTCSVVEPNSSEANEAKRLLSVEVYNSTLETADLPAGKFDIIHVGDTLEHVKDPYGFISKIKTALNNNGILMLDLPLDYNKNIFNFFLRLNMFFKKNKHSSNPPYHLLEFDRRTIFMFLKKCKMSVLKFYLYENRPICNNFIVDRDKLKFYSYCAIKTVSYIFSTYLGGKNLGFGNRITIISNKTQ